jgi:hypothetical protein
MLIKGSMLASASTLPLVRELFRFLNDIEGADVRTHEAYRETKISE